MPADLPDRARLDDGVAHGVVRKFVGPYGNLETNISEVDLKILGIERGEAFEVGVGGQQLRAVVVEGFAEGQSGEWVMIAKEPSRLILGRHSSNAMSELDVEAGARIEIRPIEPGGD